MRDRLVGNGPGLKLLAFALAVVLWLVVVNIDDPVMSKTFTGIEVTVANDDILSNASEPQTYQIVDGTQMVDVTVTAKRKTLSKIKAQDIIAIADMKEMSLESQIPIDIKILRFEGAYSNVTTSPRNIQISLEEEVTKTFPVVASTTGTIRDGYLVGEITANPEKITMRGPKSVIDSVSRVEASASVSGVSRNRKLAASLTLYDKNGEKIDQGRLVNNLGEKGLLVEVQVLSTKTVPVYFETESIYAGDGYKVDGITYEPEVITIAGPEEKLRKVEAIEVAASALASAGLNQSVERSVDISGFLPEGIRLADENANNVVVSISVSEIGAQTFKVSLGQITINGLRDDLTMEYTTSDALEVQVRGPQNMLHAIEENRICSMDLSAYKEAGTYTVPVNLELPEGCSPTKPLVIEVQLKKK